MRAIAVEPGTFHTIGHSIHEMEAFQLLLLGHDIDTLVDLRSAPYSRQVPQFNKPFVEKGLARVGIRYLFAGDSLGGRPTESDMYGEDGKVLYWKVAQTQKFRRGIEGLWRLHSSHLRIALMCSEENPQDCHRRLLVGRVLRRQGAYLVHIRGDGRAEEEAGIDASQQTLFGEAEEPGWKSIRSVLPRKAHLNSSPL